MFFIASSPPTNSLIYLLNFGYFSFKVLASSGDKKRLPPSVGSLPFVILGKFSFLNFVRLSIQMSGAGYKYAFICFVFIKRLLSNKNFSDLIELAVNPTITQ